jgi:hypothetical protein
MQPSFTTVIRGLTADERTALGWCSLTGCERTPEVTDRFGLLWCARCAAVNEAQNRPVKGRSS